MRKSMVRSVAFAAVVAACMITTSACSSSGAKAGGDGASSGATAAGGSSTRSATTSGGSTGSATISTADVAKYLKVPTALPVTTPVSKPIPSGLTIVFVGNGTPEGQKVEQGLAAAAAVLGWTVRVNTYDATNPATLLTAIQSAIATKPAAIVMASVLIAQIQSVVPAAVAAHVPIVLCASPNPNVKGVYAAGDSAVESTYTGKILGETLVADAASQGKTAHVVQLTVSAFAAILGYLDNGVADAMSSTCPHCTHDVLDLPLADVYNGHYTAQVVSYLQSHPDVNAVVSDSSELADGLPAALKQAGLTNVTVNGIGPGQEQIQEMLAGGSGTWSAYTLQVTGWMVADEIARVTVGDDTGLWLPETLDYVVNKTNVAGVNPTDPEFPAGYQVQFKALWHK